MVLPECAFQLSIIDSKVQYSNHYTSLPATVCSADYTVLQIKNSMRSISAINPVATENTYNKHNSMQTQPQGSHIALL